MKTELATFMMSSGGLGYSVRVCEEKGKLTLEGYRDAPIQISRPAVFSLLSAIYRHLHLEPPVLPGVLTDAAELLDRLASGFRPESDIHQEVDAQVLRLRAHAKISRLSETSIEDAYKARAYPMGLLDEEVRGFGGDPARMDEQARFIPLVTEKHMTVEQAQRRFKVEFIERARFLQWDRAQYKEAFEQGRMSLSMGCMASAITAARGPVVDLSGEVSIGPEEISISREGMRRLREQAPPEHILDAVRGAGVQSPCEKSKRGVAIYRPENGELISQGWNARPYGGCDGSAVCRARCGELCVHAEERAVRSMLVEMAKANILPGYPLAELVVVHAKVVDGQLVPTGGPSCITCSRTIADIGLAGVMLLEADGWRYYPAREFHERTIKATAKKE